MPISFARFAGFVCRVAIAGCCAMTSAHGAVMMDAAWVDCDQQQDRLTIRHDKASRDDARATVFWPLIGTTRRPDGDPDQVSELRSASHSCRLSGGLFEVELRPVPMNTNLQGLCGAIVRGSVTVLRDGKPVLERELETGECAGPTKRVAAITISGKGGPVLVDLAGKAP